LLALERLAPLERAAFLLHDVLDVPFAEVAQALGRAEPAVRKLATRALEISDGRIAAIYVVRNPEKLKGVASLLSPLSP
jgi:DNA-directed RNA polymerase specialized sigma24 family protein